MKTRYISAPLAAFMLVAMAVALHADPIELEWRTIVQGLESAPKENKFIVLDIYTDWCGWCKRMDRDTYKDSNVVGYMSSRFIPCKMNPEKSGKLTYDGKEYTLGEFSQALGVTGFPTTVIFDQKGKILTALPGYMAPKDFLPLLKYFGEGVYQSGTSYEDYMKGGGAKSN
ncbi:MAG: thioredoxin fold domain-containing protein [Bacteroidetes bacterium]|nr:thioredoxin fold domain-containing protein [Bacteroidota bacterium]